MNIPEILSDIRELDKSSLDYLREHPADWAVSRKRLFCAGLLRGDEEQITTIWVEVASVVGPENAFLWGMSIWGDMVRSGLDEDAQADLAQW